MPIQWAEGGTFLVQMIFIHILLLLPAVTTWLPVLTPCDSSPSVLKELCHNGGLGFFFVGKMNGAGPFL
jgi:hypothetical protein